MNAAQRNDAMAKTAKAKTKDAPVTELNPPAGDPPKKPKKDSMAAAVKRGDKALGKWLLDHQTVPDKAWKRPTDPPRDEKESRSDYIKRVLMGAESDA